MATESPTFYLLPESKLHPDDRMFGFIPAIICVGCGYAIGALAQPLPSVLYGRHPEGACCYSGRLFRFHALPIVGTLMPVDFNLNAPKVFSGGVTQHVVGKEM